MSYFYLLPALFLLSSFFSGVEASYFSISKIEQRRLWQLSRRVQRLYAHPNRLLVAILISNTVVNVMIASLSTILALSLVEDYRWHLELTLFAEIFVVWFFLLIFGEILPKIFCYKHAKFVVRNAAIFLEPLVYLLFPFIFGIELLGKLLARNKKNSALTKKEIKELVDSGKLSLDLKQKKLMKNILRFPDTKIAQVMIPRVDIVAIEQNQLPQEVIQIIIQSGFSRIPVYRDQIDNIVGFIYAKDIILLQEKKVFQIEELMREPLFVTESMPISKVLNMFKKGRKHMAVVVNEYGGTCGIVTMEDVLEELVGEILDESDTKAPMIEKTSQGHKIDGSCNLYFLNQEFGLNLPAGEYDNVSEFVYDKLNKVPSPGDFLAIDTTKKLVIEKISNNRINRLVLKEIR